MTPIAEALDLLRQHGGMALFAIAGWGVALTLWRALSAVNAKLDLLVAKSVEAVAAFTVSNSRISDRIDMLLRGGRP